MKDENKEETIIIPYDRLWKAITTELFLDFVEMFLPKLFKEIDLNEPPKHLEQELKAVVKSKTNRQADKLVSVKLKNSEEKWIYVHSEFENSHSPNIKEQMYNYHSRIKEKYGQNITGMVIYTGHTTPKNENLYEKTTFGTTISSKFNTYIVNEQNEEELKVNQNPFAIVVLANLYTLRTYKNYEKRLSLKEQIYVLARERGYNDDKTRELLLFLMELIRLPNKLENEFDNYIAKPQKSTDMRPTSFRTHNYINAITKAEYGTSFQELNATIKEMDVAAKEAQKTAQAKLKIIIIRSYTKLQMSIDEIADFVGEEPKIIHDILVAEKVISRK